MKTNKNLEALKKKVEGVRHELSELNDEDLEQVIGGVSGGDPLQQQYDPNMQPGSDTIAHDRSNPMDRSFFTFNSSGAIIIK